LEDKTSTQTNASQQIGTIAYMPPEAYSGKISPAWDLWSLGVMIHQLATEKHPFPAQSGPELMRMVLTEEPQIDQSLSSPLQEIITGCLIKECKLRWATSQVLRVFTSKTILSVVQHPTPNNSVRNLEVITESLGREVTLELIKLPGGSFMIGASDNDSDATKYEKPQHNVDVKAFAIGKYPITQAQYASVMNKNPSTFNENPNHPVDTINWYQAQKFCQKLSQKTAKKYRLPTAAEWQYACRAGTTTKYFFGDNAYELEEYAWFDKNSGDETHPVGHKRPNPWGLYDVHGNVWEWCSTLDEYDKHYGGGCGCGGSYRDEWRYCRSSFIVYFNSNDRYSNYGFRVALSV
jgi:formylglycine-generating enzyme required for sulfatase activity